MRIQEKLDSGGWVSRNFCPFSFEMGSCSVAQHALEFLVLLPQPLRCWRLKVWAMLSDFSYILKTGLHFEAMADLELQRSISLFIPPTFLRSL